MTRKDTSEAFGSLISRRPRSDSILCLLFLFAAVSVPDSSAQEMPHPPKSPSVQDRTSPQPFLGSVSFYFDNDVFSGNDNGYTGGLGFVWTSAATETYSERNLQRKIANAFSFLPTVNAEGYRNSRGAPLRGRHLP